ncbi:shikimate kinase [Marinobacter salicampi]|uniref:shikimate kinase n=1 Tax=Marinobacter salicampi TaxID=435907 RepID=UPI00140B4E8D|nr:shikimate kinase [Marinobacter salicampi]
MVAPERTNVVLIGMPGSGKSTVGVLLAKRSARGFVDTDLLIQTATGQTLQEIVDRSGYQTLRKVEERELLQIELARHVIATGGSAVYSDAAMQHLRRSGVIVFLDVSLATVEARIGDFSLRGISKRADQSIQALFHERGRLYRQYADIIVSADTLDQEQTCDHILAAIRQRAG